MALIVQKYGGSSVSNVENLKRVARRVVACRREGHQLVVVVSAMGDTTDHLESLAAQISKNPPRREMDMLLSVGERTSIALLAMAISRLGVPAISFTGSQVGIITDNHHTEARILEVRCLRIREELAAGKIVVVAGFQGVSTRREITTLGRGGSDTTAVALAAALKADRCELLKDVEGIFVSEPRLVPNAVRNERIAYDEMIEMANLGASVLKTESVEMAKRYGVKLAVGSAKTGRVGTIVTDASHDSSGIKGIVGRKKMIRWEIQFAETNGPFSFLAAMSDGLLKAQSAQVFQNRLNLMFDARLRNDLDALLTGRRAELIREEKNLGVLAIIGTGLNCNSSTAKKVFAALHRLNLITEHLQVSELRIALALPESETDDAIRKLHGELLN